MLIALVLLLTTQHVAAFTIHIDARTLSSTGFLIVGKTGLLDGTTVQQLDLTPGAYSLQPGSGSVMACSFSVTAEGRIDFEGACSSFLTGRGTDTLVVRGHTIKLDARALSSTGFLVPNAFGLADQMMPSTEVRSLTLVPFNAYVFQVGSGAVGNFSWGIDQAGRITYDPAFDSFLSGRGTDTLVVRGHTIKLDARALSSTGFLVPNAFGLADQMMPSTEVRSLTLVPLNAYVFQVGAGLLADFSWGIDQAGRITYDPAFDSFLSGRRTDTLVVRGHTIKLDARALGNAGFLVPNVFGLNQMMSSAEVRPLTLVPVRGAYLFRSGTDHATFELNLDHVGHITYAPGFAGSLFGLGTDTIRVNRRICAPHVVTGFILEKWSSLGGSDGVLGCPVNNEQDIAGYKGRLAEFEQGQIAWSPKTEDLSDGFTQVAYQQGGYVYFQWGNTLPFSYDEFYVRWGEVDKRDCQDKYDDYKKSCEVTVSWSDIKGDWFIPLPNKKGNLRIVVVGCKIKDGTLSARPRCDQGWSNPIVFPYDLSFPPQELFPRIDYREWKDPSIPIPSAKIPIDAGGKRAFLEPTVAWALRSFDVRAQRFLAYLACTTDPAKMKFNQRQDDPSIIKGEDFSTAIVAKLAYKGSCQGQAGENLDEWKTRVKDVNALLKTVAKNGQLLGSDVPPGNRLTDLEHRRWGDLDIALKDLIVIPFLYWDLLDAEARQHVMETLSELKGGCGWCLSRYRIDPQDIQLLANWRVELGFLLGLEPFFDTLELSIDETENHIHMMESTRYLVNQLLRKTQPEMSDYDNKSNGLHDWWMTRLQSILKHDFQEYNSKPYSRLSLDAIQNLAEFAAEDDIRTAARMVLDFSSAKFAVSSSLLRREAPFRRRADHEKDGFFDDGGLDEQMCRFILYSGKLDAFRTMENSLEPRQDYRRAPRDCNGVVRQAIGSYRVPPMILDLAMNKEHQTTVQMFSGGPNDFHNSPGGIEIYDNTSSYMTAAGGIPLASGLQLHTHTPWWNPIPNLDINSGNVDSDYGYSVPTVLMPHDPSLVRADRTQMIRFDGFEGHKHTANHLCVGRGVACGENPIVPPLNELVPGKSGFLEALCLPDLSNRPCARSDFERGDEDQWTVWYIQLSGLTSDLYIAMWKKTFPNWPGPVGFFEVVDPLRLSPTFMNFDSFKQSVKRLNPNGPGEIHLDNEVCTDTIEHRPVCPSPGRVDVQYARGSGSGTVTFKFGRPYTQYPIVDNSSSGWKMRGTQSQPEADTGQWPFASGPVVASGHDGFISITNPAYPGACILDLMDVHKPNRMCDDPALIK